MLRPLAFGYPIMYDTVANDQEMTGKEVHVQAQSMNAALCAVRGKRYTVQQAVGLYPTSATSDDYAFNRHRFNDELRKVYGFTIEFGQQFVPPYAEMRKIMADVAAALTELCRRVSECCTDSGNV